MNPADGHLLSYHSYPLNHILTVDQLVTADLVDSSVTGVIFDVPHAHENAVELIYCVSGTIPVTRCGTVYTLKDRDVLIISPGLTHFIASALQDTVFFVISFTCRTEYLSMLRETPFQASPVQAQLFENIIGELQNAFHLNAGQLRLFSFRPNSRSPVGAEQMIACCLEQLMIGFLRDSAESAHEAGRYLNRVTRQQMADRVSYYVRAHLTEKITATDVAAVFGYSRARFSTIYKEATGLGLNEFITKEKIILAKRLLEEGQMTITQISDHLGFSSPEYFSRRFTQCVGYPPSRHISGFRSYRQIAEEETPA